MRRRAFVQSVLLSSATMALPGCAPFAGGQSAGRKQVMTVNGLIQADALGTTLTHEHLFADLRPYQEQVDNPLSPDIDEVMVTVLPYLERIRDQGCRSLIDCTATHVGRNPSVVKRLSDASGLHMIMPTGNYAAADGRFIPPYVTNGSSDALARRWLDEWENGIEGTGIRPGLIKIGVNGGSLTETESKLIRAAAQTHLESGLTIGAHVGPWRAVEAGYNATSAFEQIALLGELGVDPSAWIWIHAQSEVETAQHVRAARQGAWISFDGFRPGNEEQYVQLIDNLRKEALLHRVLLSQDAGWYTPGEPNGGDLTPYDPIFTSLLPALRNSGLSDSEIDQLMVRNPAEAFSIGVRRVGG